MTLTRRAGELEVYLGDVLVGVLRYVEGERSEFSFVDSYRDLPERPVLGQYFEDDLNKRYASRLRLIPFFSNLLPEGALRELLAGRAGVHPEREFFLIQELEEDLPGAVRLKPVGDRIDVQPLDVPTEESTLEPGLRFSLAGVQLKFSMVRGSRGLTIPMKGERGDWIVKLPDNRFAGVPENEYAVMRWARAAGIDVPEVALQSLSELGNLPEEVRQLPAKAFAVKRFDREPGRRIHIEDFAQVFGQYAHGKYKGANYERIGRVVLALDGPRGLHEYVRRLVFMVLVGNADAHLKNWSLIYSDGQHASLSPAYDLVAVVALMPNQTMGLNLGGTRRFQDITLETFQRFAKAVGADERDVLRIVREARDRTLQAVQGQQESEEADLLAKKLLGEHLASVPLAQGQ